LDRRTYLDSSLPASIATAAGSAMFYVVRPMNLPPPGFGRALTLVLTLTGHEGMSMLKQAGILVWHGLNASKSGIDGEGRGCGLCMVVGGATGWWLSVMPLHGRSLLPSV